MNALVLAAGPGYEAPTSNDFWEPWVGNGAWAITRPMIEILFSVALIAGVMWYATRRMSPVPSKGQFAAEGFYNVVRNGLGREIIGSHDFLRFVPLLFTLFALILVNNVFSIVWIIQFPTMGRIGFPIALAIIVFLVFHAVGIKDKGINAYVRSLVPPGLPGWLVPLIFVLELITYLFTRPVTLALRLFGNMFAGHILLVLMMTGADYMLLHSHALGLQILSFAPFLGSIVLTFFELLIEVLQAYIFTLLASLYIAGALAAEH